jgi:hypothetical protein
MKDFSIEINELLSLLRLLSDARGIQALGEFSHLYEA